MEVSIQGLQKAQAANLQLIQSLKPGGALERAVRYAALQAHRYAVSITHVDTGALRASHRIDREAPHRYRIYIDPTAVNPRGDRPYVYGPIEHSRGGSHAFYARTVYEAGGRILERTHALYSRTLP